MTSLYQSKKELNDVNNWSVISNGCCFYSVHIQLHEQTYVCGLPVCVSFSFHLSNAILLNTFVIPKLTPVDAVYTTYKIHESDRSESNSFVKFFKKREDEFNRGTAEFTTKYLRNFEIRKQIISSLVESGEETLYETTLKNAKENLKPNQVQFPSTHPTPVKLHSKRRTPIEPSRIHRFTERPDFVAKIIERMVSRC
ncbi:unnamed protein product [Orchesella dallaii]|uniref:Uncharacterized protein n=1 Tax=Orchesella dallaii TaxID=48710 RepID=A0ABP1R086_9HEXA